MKKRFKIICCVALALAVIIATAVLVSAEGISLHTINQEDGDKSVNRISYGLDIMANNYKIEVAGINGSPLNFSEKKIACAMNLSEINEIEIVSLPDENCGVLYLGNDLVKCNQKISKNGIELLSYETKGCAENAMSSFALKVNGSAYEIECRLFMLDNVNASPTLSCVPVISLNVETYRDVDVNGILCAYDPEGDAMTYEIVSYPKNGYLEMKDNHSGEYTYTPVSGYTGQDSFTYVVKDQYGNYSASATVNVKVSVPYSNIVYNDLLDRNDYNYALNMTEKNLMNGEKVGDCYYFRPESKVSRIDFVVSVMKMLGIENLPDVEKTVFADDADIGAEVKGYVSLAYSKEYVSGISEDGQLYFRPDDNIKMSEAAVILSNIIGYSEYQTTPTFANSEEIPTWSKQAVMSLRALGIIEMPEDAIFENVNVSRIQMAKLLSRAAWVSENI